MFKLEWHRSGGVVKTFRWQTLAVPMPEERQPNPNVPPLVAAAFVAHAQQTRDINLEFDTDCLVTRFESSLNSSLFGDTTAPLAIPSLQNTFDVKSAAAAYLGQTLVLRYDGRWTGYFATDALTNFYTATISFGDYSVHPICWLSYRLTNGTEEGTVADWLNRVMPSITARKDVTPQTGFIEDIY